MNDEFTRLAIVRRFVQLLRRPKGRLAYSGVASIGPRPDLQSARWRHVRPGSAFRTTLYYRLAVLKNRHQSYYLNCTKFGKLILRKNVKIVATGCHILKLK